MWSGGNGNVTRAIESSDFVNLSAQRSNVYGAAGFFRSDQRTSRRTTCTPRPTAAWSLAPAGCRRAAAAVPVPGAGQRSQQGEPATGVDLEMDGLRIEWRFDAASG
jgi:hypothetical protein